VDFTRRFGEGRPPPDRPPTDAAMGSQDTPAALLPCRRQLVTVLASVVLHCLETTP
jgi:hypothetical protein